MDSEPQATDGGAKAPPSRLAGRPLAVAGSLLAAAGVLLLVFFLLPASGPVVPCCAPDDSLLRAPHPAPDAATLDAASGAVYLLVLEDTDGHAFEVGTAWVLDERHLVSSAGAAALFAALGEDERLVARPPGPEDEAAAAQVTLVIAGAEAHPAAALLAERLPAAQAANPAAGRAALLYDIALLTLAEGSRPAPPLPLAPPGSLRPGDGVGSVLYRRVLSEGRPRFRQETASGRVLALSGLFGEPAMGEPRLLLHDLEPGAAAAGAPLLDDRGRVVGVLGGVAFVADGDSRYPLGGAATAVEALADLRAGEAAADAALLGALWQRGTALLSGEPDAAETLLAARLLGSAEHPPAEPAVLREGRLGKATSPFEGAVALETFDLAPGRYLLIAGSGTEGVPPPPAQLYLDGERLTALPWLGGSVVAGALRLPQGGSLTVALLGGEDAPYRLHLLAWPD